MAALKRQVKLSNGLMMPQIHLGLYLMSGPEAVNAVPVALEAGYRGFDSAQIYQNEHEAGKAILEFLNSGKNTAKLRREDIWFTTKLASNTSYEDARQSIKDSVRACGLGYIDLFLLHSPYGGQTKRLESWKAVEDAIEAGEVKSGGVSNFGIKHLKELFASGPRHRPTVNQIEVNPFNTRRELTEFCQANDIVVEAYAPLAQAMKMTHHTISSLAKKYSCSPAQVMITWSLQHGFVPLPKSVNKERIITNAEVDDIHIDDADIKVLDGLDEVLLTGWDPLDAD